MKSTSLNSFINALNQKLDQSAILLDPAERCAYSYDNSRHEAIPDVVVLAQNHHEVVDLVTLCNKFSIPLTVRGRGTGTTGACVPIQGGVVLSLEAMQRIVKIDPANRVMVVEPGVTNKTVQMAAQKHGFFWAPDPTSSAISCIGGNLGCNAAGPRAVKYGTCRENTLGLQAVTGAGETIHTGVYTTKGVVGYDLTRLLIGSEGTLAIITEATLKLIPLPESVATLQAFYHSIQDAALAVSAIMSQPFTPSALEFIDGKAINMIRNHSQYTLPSDAQAMLIIEIDGAKSALAEMITKVTEASKNEGLISITAAKNPEETKTIWDIRKSLSPTLKTVAAKKINEDVVVPVSNIPALITEIERLSHQYKINIINFGHAGNGNIHVNLLINPEDPIQQKNANECLDKIFDTVLKLHGTLSGEHGVGIEKRDFINKEIDSTTLDLMRKIKQQFDPHGILNPGKLFPLT